LFYNAFILENNYIHNNSVRVKRLDLRI